MSAHVSASSGVDDDTYFCMVMHVPFHIRSLQFQQGGTDYGLFATAFVIEFCIGNNPRVLDISYCSVTVMYLSQISLNSIFVHVGMTRKDGRALSHECSHPRRKFFLFLFLFIRESVDSLCRDGADAQYMQYLSKSCIT